MLMLMRVHVNLDMILIQRGRLLGHDQDATLIVFLMKIASHLALFLTLILIVRMIAPLKWFGQTELGVCGAWGLCLGINCTS